MLAEVERFEQLRATAGSAILGHAARTTKLVDYMRELIEEVQLLRDKMAS